MHYPSPTTTDRQLTPAEHTRLAQEVGAQGEEKTRQILGIGKLPLARLLAQLPVLRATLAVTRAALAKLSKDGEA